MLLPEGYKQISNNIAFMILREDLSPNLFDTSLKLLFKQPSDKLLPLTGGRNDIFLSEVNKNFYVLLKLYSHGGLLKNLFSTKYYYFSNRFLNEFYLYTSTLKNNIPVPEYLGGFWIKRHGLYKCGVITQYLSDTVTLENYLRIKTHTNSEKYDILIKCGRTIRTMHNIGILHNDLQIRNILINPAEKSVYLIDFDNAKKLPSINLFNRTQNLLRLKRSFFKRDISIDFFSILLNGYDISDLSSYSYFFSYPHIQWIKVKKFFNKKQ